MGLGHDKTFENLPSIVFTTLSVPLTGDRNLPDRLRRIPSKIIPSFFTSKEGSTSHLGLLSSGEKKETALRCSEPLRYKVGGPSKVFAILCGMGPPCHLKDQSLLYLPTYITSSVTLPKTFFGLIIIKTLYS